MMALTVFNINGKHFVNVDELIDEFVETRAFDCGEYSYNSICDSDDEVVDGIISYLLDTDHKDIAMKLKTAWIRKRYGSFFRE